MTPLARTLRFETHRIVRASPDEVWRVLGDFGTEHRWTRSVKECSRDTPEPRVGTTRDCQLPRPLMGRTRAREMLVEYAPGSSLAYTLDGSAGPFATARSRWSIRPEGDATRVTVEGVFTAKNRFAALFVWPLAKPAIGRLTRKVLSELDAFVTRGSHA